ncbi:MAG: GNAT family N-acetyltransferase [Chloroflexi bacterium]|nr:GNAT family N-acetyltransferase [Chloroflexota bacterium]
MSVVVRLITHEDFDAVTALLAELGRPALTEEKLTAVRAAYHTHVNDPHTFSLIAEVDGEAAGFISLELRHRLNWGTLEAWIPDFIVTEEARGTGVGHALFERAVEIAREHGCHRITLESGYARDVAHKFYERHGMTNGGYYFVMMG